ncbi:hypothetical protein NDU88_003099 [Pleurodeles waltl]|uniref:Myb/SANT-like DNA-binding domain-containing protein n=1 Tax=Pleurodeles waltl TaxID=8319 RepID=A0AAV7LHK5_PLEWA|nr:hypothetical protein NDU88_003099 [Pleurodeles waltl]
MELGPRVMDGVNAVGQHPRTRDDIKKRWNDLQGKVSAHQKKGIWRAIAKEVRTQGVFDRRSTHCLKRWEDLRRWARKTAEAQLRLAFQ